MRLVEGLLVLPLRLRGDDHARPRGEEDLLPTLWKERMRMLKSAPAPRRTPGSLCRPPGTGSRSLMASITVPLGAPVIVPRGRGSGRPPQGGPGAALHLGDQVHHVGVALHGEKLPDPHCSGPGHPGEVVPEEVHEHHVLRPLLGRGEELPL